jgi:hypothetical protein
MNFLRADVEQTIIGARIGPVFELVGWGVRRLWRDGMVAHFPR